LGSVILIVATFLGYLVAYHTYGRFLADKIFKLDENARVPSRELEDGTDYVPTRKGIIFGHHYTSIAGTGPIVGPAIGIIWGWVPALIWDCGDRGNTHQPARSDYFLLRGFS